MHAGRPSLGMGHVDCLEGSEEAKHRLKVILETLAGLTTVVAGCEELRLHSSRFHTMRREGLQAALERLELRLAGRPPKVAQAEESVEKLQGQVVTLRAEKKAAELREEVAVVRAGVRVRKKRG